jgi:hypothetical protein
MVRNEDTDYRTNERKLIREKKQIGHLMKNKEWINKIIEGK